VTILYKSGPELPGAVETYTTKMDFSGGLDNWGADEKPRVRTQEHFVCGFEKRENKDGDNVYGLVVKQLTTDKSGKTRFAVIKRFLEYKTQEASRYGEWLECKVNAILIDGRPYWVTEDEGAEKEYEEGEDFDF